MCYYEIKLTKLDTRAQDITPPDLYVLASYLSDQELAFMSLRFGQFDAEKSAVKQIPCHGYQVPPAGAPKL